MKIAIVGSREGFSYERVAEFVGTLRKSDIVISGGARGIDTFAENAAIARGMDVLIYQASWDTLGKSAGFVRNKVIVDTADRVVAFWNGTSAGTRHTIELAIKANKPTMIIYPNRATHKPTLRGYVNPKVKR